VKISVKFPGVQATDLRTTVTLTEAGTPWPIRLHFLHVTDTDTGDSEDVNVGFELGERFETHERGTASVPLESDPVSLDVAAVQRIAANYTTYLEFARHAIVLDSEGMDGAIKRLRPGRRVARLTDDYLRIIAGKYEELQRAGESRLLETIGESVGAHKSTVSRWIKEARTRGLLNGE
jgi:hypothetical protein